MTAREKRDGRDQHGSPVHATHGEWNRQTHALSPMCQGEFGGVRMALGANRRDVLALIVSQGMKLVTGGLVLGLAGAIGRSRVLHRMLYGIKPTDAATFAGVSLILLAVALFACWLTARRASRADPIVALRSE